MPVIALFWASWCTACKRSETMLNEIKNETNDIKTIHINVDKNSEIRDEYNILGVPTFIIFENGKPKQRITGAISKKQLISKI